MVIGGSTASGKSALALALARRFGSVVINADSQQLFADLPILTARPSTADEQVVPHLLYGLLDASEQPSVGRWLALVQPTLAKLQTERRPAVIVGGTGLYLHALLQGIPAMPDIPAALRAELRAWAAASPAAALYARLQQRDPSMAARLQPGDQQRVLRALEVIEATGRSLIAWQADTRQRLNLSVTPIGIALVPPPALVNPRLEARLDAMLDEGVMTEVADLLERRPGATQLPIAKVHGLRELAAVHRGALPVDQARASIVTQIRQYAKRQRTWFRHQLPQLQPVVTTGETNEALDAVIASLDTR